MAASEEIRNIARRNFEQAKLRKHADLAASETPTQAKAIEDNYEKALATYLDTLIEGFAEANSNWNQLVADAAKAEEELQRARESAEELPVRLKAMAKLTSSVADLVEAAK
ncbi:hypothetical protein [Allosphingosinicella sp.]|uniref:hypothetical protein n=1 Tax=Allosphingosinicella sp. TaxID=2823234 RepID=UPI002FC0D83A